MDAMLWVQCYWPSHTHARTHASGMDLIFAPLGGWACGLVNGDMSQYIERAAEGNRWFREYCDVQTDPRYFFVTDILTLCHNIGGGEGGPPPGYIHPCHPTTLPPSTHTHTHLLSHRPLPHNLLAPNRAGTHKRVHTCLGTRHTQLKTLASLHSPPMPLAPKHLRLTVPGAPFLPYLRAGRQKMSTQHLLSFMRAIWHTSTKGARPTLCLRF